jgi:NAD(P)-dependent dehydrogenase (short-subunit alcohol dehydrogenase family)
LNDLLQNEVALITGGASGIGLAVAERFLVEGARVAVLDSSRERLRNIDRKYKKRILTVAGDVRSYPDNVEAVQKTIDKFGQLSILIANAGIYDQGLSLSDVSSEVLETAFDEIVGVNLKGYVFCAKAALHELRRQRGTIIFTSSVSGMHAGFGGFLYVMTKHAVSGLTRQLAMELAPEIRVNAIAPGYIQTNLRGLSSINQEEPTDGGADPERFLLKSVPQSSAYAGLYAMMASRNCASIITGSTMLADGGASLLRATRKAR